MFDLNTANKTHPSWLLPYLIEFKYCDDTRPESQLQKAEEQHRRLVAILKTQGCSKFSLHVILMGVMGAIYKFHTLCIWQIPHSANSVLITAKLEAKKLTKDRPLR